MSDIPNMQGTNFGEIGLRSPVKIDGEKSEKNQFLQLFVAQLKNQNPLEPQDGSDFLAQLAQFSTVEGIKNLETSFNKIADSMQSNQALQATSLVGKKVHVKTNVGLMVGQAGVTGAIDIPKAANDVKLNIYNDKGQIVKSYNFNAQNKGDLAFNWDGLDENGAPLPQGVYRFEAVGLIDGMETACDTYIASNVDSVTINKNGEPMTLNVQNFGKVSLEDIKTIS